MSFTLKSPEEQEKMRVAGVAAARVLSMIEPHVQPGVSTDELAEDYIIPSPFDRSVAPRVADAVADKAREMGLVRPGSRGSLEDETRAQAHDAAHRAVERAVARRYGQQAADEIRAERLAAKGITPDGDDSEDEAPEPEPVTGPPAGITPGDEDPPEAYPGVPV